MGSEMCIRDRAMIDGECYFVGCMFNDSNKDTITALYNQAMASVRPYSG